MKRQILRKLQDWRVKPHRKPLLLKGVRQSGKTYILKEFAQHFSQSHYINFEKNTDVHAIFEQNLEPKRILNELSFYCGKNIRIDTDLIIFDEIQACPLALTSLKYFCEELPEMALCAAGSLLGLQLTNISFPVGKVDIMDMYPMSFSEFLAAIHDEKSVDFLDVLTADHKIPDIIHTHLWQQLKIYFIVGGMPEAVKCYRDQGAHISLEIFDAVRETQAQILAAYYADIAKHAGKVNAMHIDRILRSVPSQLARAQEQSTKKFQFNNIVPGVDRYQRLADAIDWLEATGLVIKVPIVNSAELPLSAYRQDSLFKLYLFDAGFLGVMANLPPEVILNYQYGTYKGYFAENFVAQALLVSGEKNLYSWQDHRSEVEFLRIHHGKILPIEVKSGTITKSQSLHKLVEKYQLPARVILSGRNMAIDDQRQVYHYPLYLADKLSHIMP